MGNSSSSSSPPSRPQLQSSTEASSSETLQPKRSSEWPWQRYLTGRSPHEAKLLIHGLNGAGKTTLLMKFKQPSMEIGTTIPTIGYNVEQLNYNGYTLDAWDLGGRCKMRASHYHFYPHTDAMIFVIDSVDGDYLEEATFEINKILAEDALAELPMLVFCNKQDLPNALSVAEIAAAIGINESGMHKGHPIMITGGSAQKGVGVTEALIQLTNVMKKSQMNQRWEIVQNMAQQQRTALVDASVPDLLGYHPVTNNLVLQRFNIIKKQTECPFARVAKLWGAKPTPRSPNSAPASLVESAQSSAPALAEFVKRSNAGKDLDGFCVELDDPSAREGGPDQLGKCVRIFLTALAKNDPSDKENTCMKNPRFIGRAGWTFQFCKARFFLTVFAPCYPETSSRYGFGSSHAFLLFQPEESFLRHDLPPDTPHTAWDHPKTVRDRARVKYSRAGRKYHIPDSVSYPAAEHIVKPLNEDGMQVVRWWTDNEKDNERGDADTYAESEDGATVASSGTSPSDRSTIIDDGSFSDGVGDDVSD